MESSLSSEPPVNTVLSIINTTLTTTDVATIFISVAVVVALIICSAIISSSENAFFSLSKIQIEELTEEESRTAQYTEYLINHPKHLLATILISNTFVNIAIVMVSTVIIDLWFDFSAGRCALLFL